jgi:apolipoprotein N-acyltransferase
LVSLSSVNGLKRIAVASLGGFALAWALENPRTGLGWTVALAALGCVAHSVFGQSLWWRCAAGIASGIVFFGSSNGWARLFGDHAWVALALALTAFWTAGLVVGGFPTSTKAFVPVFASSVSLAELARTRFPLGGYGLSLVGYTQVGGPLKWLARWFGVAGVSWVSVAIGGALAATYGGIRGPLRRPLGESGRRSLAATAMALVFVGLPGHFPEDAGYRGPVQDPAGTAGFKAAEVGQTEVSLHRIGTSNPRGGRLRVAVIQVYDFERGLTPEEEESGFLQSLLADATAALRGQGVDLVVWPEGSLGSKDPETELSTRAALAAAAANASAFILANGQPTTVLPGRFVNRNYLFDPGGKLVAVSDKTKLVPFGEYVPLRSFLQPRVRMLDRVPIDAQSSRSVVFSLNGTRLGAVVCFESTFGDFVRRKVTEGAEIIVVETNNRSFERSNLSTQHVTASRMRAIETDRFVVHAALSGISAVFAPDGSFLDDAGLYERKTLVADVETRSSITPYVRLGDFPVAAFSAGLLVFGILLNRKGGKKDLVRQ